MPAKVKARVLAARNLPGMCKVKCVFDKSKLTKIHFSYGQKQ